MTLKTRVKINLFFYGIVYFFSFSEIFVDNEGSVHIVRSDLGGERGSAICDNQYRGKKFFIQKMFHGREVGSKNAKIHVTYHSNATLWRRKIQSTVVLVPNQNVPVCSRNSCFQNSPGYSQKFPLIKKLMFQFIHCFWVAQTTNS